MALSKYHDFEILDAMLAIAEITGLEFDHVCRTNLTTWWGAIYKQMIKDGECPKPFNKISKEQAIKFKGALVLDPKPGFYKNATMVDAKSLYPSMAVAYNIGFETVNCKCCKSNPHAKPKIHSRFFEGCKYISKTKNWICRKRDSAFKKKLKIFKQERFEQKRLKNKAKDLAIKLLMNGGYGIFGHSNWEFYNPMVAEFVTTYGRYTLTKMQNIAKQLGFEIIYGDTDSLLLSNPPSEKALKTFQNLDVELEIKRRYRLCLLSAGKKHYIGIGVDEDGEYIFEKVGFEGKKRDRCAYFQKTSIKNLTNYIK